MNRSTRVGTLHYQLHQLQPVQFDVCKYMRTLASAHAPLAGLLLFGVNKILDMRKLTLTLIFMLWFIKVFQFFLVPLFWFWFFENLMLHTWPLIYLFILGRDRFFTVYICFKELLFFISKKISSKDFSLPRSTWK